MILTEIERDRKGSNPLSVSLKITKGTDQLMSNTNMDQLKSSNKIINRGEQRLTSCRTKQVYNRSLVALLVKIFPDSKKHYCGNIQRENSKSCVTSNGYQRQ